MFLKHIFVLVFGHYSPSTIHRHYSLARGTLTARCWLFWNQVWFIALAWLHVCMCVWLNQEKWLSVLDWAWNSVGVYLWLECYVCVCGCSLFLPASSLGLPLSHLLLTLTQPTLSNLLKNTIHLNLLLLISPRNWWNLRVGLDEKLLLVTGYAWTPRT